LVIFADSTWSRDEYVGGCLFGVIGGVMAVISLIQHRGGRPIAFAALVLGAIGALTSLGNLS